MNRLVLERNSSTRASASATLLAQHVDFTRKPLARGAGLVAARALLGRDVGVGDRVGDLRGEIRIGRLELDRDDARLVDRENRQPLGISFQHALFRRHAQRVLGKAKDAQRIAHERDATQRGIELGALVELEVLDHLARHVARSASCTWLVTAS